MDKDRFSVNRIKPCLALLALAPLLGCTPNEKELQFDVEYGRYQTVLREAVGQQGQLSCKVKIKQNHTGPKWVPSVIIAAAEDDAEDDTLFLSSDPVAGSDQRRFHLRTFNRAKPIIDAAVLRAPNNDDAFGLRLSWHRDGAISYQVDNGDGWTAAQRVGKPGFSVRHVSVHASGLTGTATCLLTDNDATTD